MKKERIYQLWCYLSIGWGIASLLWTLVVHNLALGVLCLVVGAGCLSVALMVRPNRLFDHSKKTGQ